MPRLRTGWPSCMRSTPSSSTAMSSSKTSFCIPQVPDYVIRGCGILQTRHEHCICRCIESNRPSPPSQHVPCADRQQQHVPQSSHADAGHNAIAVCNASMDQVAEEQTFTDHDLSGRSDSSRWCCGLHPAQLDQACQDCL